MSEQENLTIRVSSQIARSGVDPEQVVKIMATILKVYINNNDLESQDAAGMLRHVADDLTPH